MTNQSGIHYLHGQTTPGGQGKAMEEVQKIRETVTAGLSDLLQGTFDSVDDSLFELANNARSNNEQNRFFEAMREVRIKRKGVERRFQQALYRLFDEPPRPADPATSTESLNADNLSLVNNDVLEQEVALNAMITKARAHFQGVLLQLQVRFSALYGRPEEEAINPLAPEHLCAALVDAIADLDIQIRERLIVLKQFDRYVIANLGLLLEEANRIMVQAGIVPNFKYRSTASTSAPGTRATPAPSSESPDRQQSDTGSLGMIRELLARTGDYRLTAPPRSGYHIVNENELYSLLARLPSHPPEPDLTRGRPVALDLRQLVADLLAQQGGEEGKRSALAEMDEDLINLVSMLFEFILDDYNLSPPIQVLISRLQIPILKVVIKDRTFFSKAAHPARKLLNALARAGIGWSDSNDKNRDKLYEQIHNIVQRILEEYDGDIGIFESLNEEFDQFLARENRKATLVEQRTRESERGRIKSQKAQETVDRILSEKLRARAIPDSIRNILENGWSRVMFLAYLRDDNEHRWSQSVRVVDDLLWCLRPQPHEDERAQWVRLVPALLKTLRAGLEEVSYNASRLDEMMAGLKRELTEAFRRQALEEAAEEEGLASPVAPQENLVPTAVEREQELEDAAMAEHLLAVEGIGVGTWVEFSLVNGTRFRCKLSAVIEDADSFVFVNRMGLKVVEKKRLDLAHDHRRGRLTVLEQGALVDRALDSVIGSLRRKAS